MQVTSCPRTPATISKRERFPRSSISRVSARPPRTLGSGCADARCTRAHRRCFLALVLPRPRVPDARTRAEPALIGVASLRSSSRDLGFRLRGRARCTRLRARSSCVARRGWHPPPMVAHRAAFATPQAAQLGTARSLRTSAALFMNAQSRRKVCHCTADVLRPSRKGGAACLAERVPQPARKAGAQCQSVTTG